MNARASLATTELAGLERFKRAASVTSADLLLFVATAMALVLLLMQTPRLRVVDWFYVLQHTTILVMALTRPAPVVTDYTARTSVAVALTYFYPYALVLCLRRLPTATLWPAGGLFLVTLAAVFSVVCLLAIGTRFGIRPALRGLVTSGPYRCVRHPLYLSYLVADIGYNLQLSNPTALALLALTWTAMTWRIQAEERVLSSHPGWSDYKAKVSYRLIPAIW